MFTRTFTKVAILCAVVFLLALSASPVLGQSCGTHVVRAGENLFRIGLRYGIDYRTLAVYNGIPDPTRIYAGQVIGIPCRGGATAATQQTYVPAIINSQIVIPAAQLQPQYPITQYPYTPYQPYYGSSWSGYQPSQATTVDCTGFRATSPVDGFPLGAVTFYWDPPRSAALAARYHVRILNERGLTVLAREVLAPYTSLTADVSVGGIGSGNRFSWYVTAVTADNRVCQSQIVTIPREWSPLG